MATLLLSVISIALCAVAFAGCHCHNKHGYERVEATCTEDGYVKIWCDECNYVHEETVKPFPRRGTASTAKTIAPSAENPTFQTPRSVRKKTV